MAAMVFFWLVLTARCSTSLFSLVFWDPVKEEEMTLLKARTNGVRDTFFFLVNSSKGTMLSLLVHKVYGAQVQRNELLRQLVVISTGNHDRNHESP